MNIEHDEQTLQLLQAACIEQLETVYKLTAFLESTSELPGAGFIHDQLYVTKAQLKNNKFFYFALGSEDYLDLQQLDSETNNEFFTFFEKVNEQLALEGKMLYDELSFSKPQNKSGEYLSKKQFRVYRSIFFVRDDEKQSYSGRLYLYLVT